MSSWKQSILTFLVCSLTCGILSQIVSDTGKTKLIQFISGTFLAVTVLSGFARIDPADFHLISAGNRNPADAYIAMGKQAAAEEQKIRITADCEAYILDKAKELGAEVTAKVSLDELLVPVFVEITCESDRNLQPDLQKILTMDLGIPKENQQWIWNQENNSS
jgi:hypothetical protein